MVVGGLSMIPIWMEMGSPSGKTVAQFKSELAKSIETNKSKRNMCYYIEGGSDFGKNIKNNDYIIKGSSDVVMLVTCVHPTGKYASMEFVSYETPNSRYYAVLADGVFVSY